MRYSISLFPVLRSHRRRQTWEEKKKNMEITRDRPDVEPKKNNNTKKVVSWEDEKKNGHNLYKISLTAYQQKPLNRDNQKRHYIITR